MGEPSERQPLLGQEEQQLEINNNSINNSTNQSLLPSNLQENPWIAEQEAEDEQVPVVRQTSCFQKLFRFKLFIAFAILALLLTLYFVVYFILIPVKVQNALNGQGSIVKHVHIQDLGLASSIIVGISVFIPLNDPAPVDAIVEFGPLVVSHIDDQSGTRNSLASFQLNNLDVGGNSPFAWINSTFGVENLNFAHVAWVLKSIVSNNMNLPNFALTGTPSVGIPMLRGKWTGILNRLYDLKSTTDSNSETPSTTPSDSSFQNFTVHNATVDIGLSSRGMEIKSLVQAGFMNMLPLTVAPQDVAFDFWIYHNNLPVANFMSFATKYGLGLSSGLNDALLDLKVSIINMRGAVELVADWFGLGKDAVSPPTSVQVHGINIRGGEKTGSSRWTWLQNLVSGLSIPLALPKNKTRNSFNIDPSLFNASVAYGQCNVNMSIATLVIEGHVNYTNPFFVSLVDPIWLNFELWLLYNNVSTVKVTSTKPISVSMINGANKQPFHLSAQATDIDMATELFGRYASGQDSVVTIAKMKVSNALDDSWYWMNGMLDSLMIPLTIPGAPEDDGGESPFPDCQM